MNLDPRQPYVEQDAPARLRPSAQQRKDQSAVRAFVSKAIIPHADRFDREEQIPRELVGEIARQGYLGAILPVQYGGRAMDAISYGLLNEELGRGCASVRGLVMIQNMVAQTILDWGTERQRERWLRSIAMGDVLSAFALTEPDVGSDAKRVKTAAIPDGDCFVVDGHKKWITLGQIAQVFLLIAQSEGRLCAFLLERDTPGLSVEPTLGMLGMRASMVAELRLNHCRIPRTNLLGGVGFGLAPVAFTALNLGRYSIAWGCVGLAQACLEASIHHARTREQFGDFLKGHQLIQAKIADMIANVRAARLLCFEAGHLRESNDPGSLLAVLVAKYFASSMATRAASHAVQILGALGCSSERPVQRHLRDAKIMEIIEGTTEMHQIMIAGLALRQTAPA